MPGFVVLGARNLGGAILDRFLADGWSGAAIVRSEETAEAVRARGATGIVADVTDREALRAALARAREGLGSIDAVVNAVSLAPPPGPGAPWGGGPAADAPPEAFDAWCAATARLCHSFLALGAEQLRASGGGTLIQVSNATSRHAVAGAGLWSAGQQAARAITQAAALELRDEGIHACFLIAGAPIDSPKSRPRMEADGVPVEAALDMGEIAKAVAYLVSQGPRGQSYVLDLSAAQAGWIP
jgi:NAD(P)-dependent dehydrogenase (short-subunit alcohol dehydrogenase family)